MTAPFIVIEGLDGSGKTTLARALAESLGAEFRTTPNPSLRVLRREILDALGPDRAARQVFYAATVLSESVSIRGRIREDVPVVLDRYWLSTMVYARMRGGHVGLPEVERRLLTPTLTVFVDADLNTRLDRLGRRTTSAEDRETMSPESHRKLREGFLSGLRGPLAGATLVVDSAEHSVAELVALVRARLRELSGSTT